MTRFLAFTIHLGASLLIFIVFLGIMFFAWYPAPYFEIDGGWKVLRILVGVDIVLGPLLTLIVFKPGKPSLKFDMSVIILAQLAALFYGTYIIYQQRPAFVVFGVDRFTSVPAGLVDFSKLRDPELKRLIGIGPLLAQIKPSDNGKMRDDILFDIILGSQKDLEFRAEFYEPYRPNIAELKNRSINLLEITKRDANAKQAINTFMTRRRNHLEDYLYIPLRGKNKDIILILSPKDGMPVDWISISPWMSDYPIKK